MRKNSILLFAILMLAVGSFTAPASARDKPDCGRIAFPLILGIGY